jgi:hypothetical protein
MDKQADRVGRRTFRIERNALHFAPGTALSAVLAGAGHGVPSVRAKTLLPSARTDWRDSAG